MLKRISLLIGSSLIIVAMSCGAATQPQQNAATKAQPTSSVSQVLNTPCATPSPDANRKLVISAPCDGAKVAQRSFVEGIVSDSNAQVWVVIHPVEGGDYWVQPNVTVREGGKWKVLCYFGESAQQYSGKHYEVTAITNPKEKLRDGQLYPNWPESESRSQVIEVTRD